jgi:hypothetical protein
MPGDLHIRVKIPYRFYTTRAKISSVEILAEELFEELSRQ